MFNNTYNTISPKFSHSLPGVLERDEVTLLLKQDGNKDFIHVKEGLKFLHNILTPYEFEVTILADRGFKSIDLFKFIDETLKWKYCIRCTKDMRISIAGKRKIKKLDDITSRKGFTKYF